MGSIVAQFAMSLDGFIATPDHGVRPLMKWYSGGETELAVPSMDMVFSLSRASATHLNELWSKIGALVTGRRDFDVSNAWGGKRFMDAPTFIVSHSVPREWAGEESPFTFVTEGVESAIEQANKAAGKQNVAVSGSTIVQQCLKLGLLDEFYIDLVPVLLGRGIRLFDDPGAELVELERTLVITAPGVTHLGFRIPR